MGERNLRVVSSLTILLKSTKANCLNVKEGLNKWQQQEV